ncbi:MAG: segregation and condensation protein A [Candidatus Limnocylindria bacterium]
MTAPADHQTMPEAIRIEPDPPVGLPVGPVPEFQIELPVFEGPLSLLLHLIESAELDVRSVPLARVTDAYVTYVATHQVDAANLAQFVATAAQLILIKSRSLLPAEPSGFEQPGVEDVDEEDLRRRLIAYRAIRDAARALAARDQVSPMWRREPRLSDLPEAPLVAMDPAGLADALMRLADVAEPEPPPPEVVPREVTVGQQIEVLRAALGETGKVVLQSILATGASRTERVVTVLAVLELVRRRELRARQKALFGPIVLEPMPESSQ